MKQTHEIKELIDQGQTQEAWEAIEHVLSLGPSNLGALKLKATLLASEGRYPQEREVWDKILDRYPDDPEAVYYFQLRFIEEKERFYFTDELPFGGRRFVVHPKSLIHASILGLIGCFAFLIFSRLVENNSATAGPLVSLVAFLFMVLSPWGFIISSYFRSLKEISITPQGIRFATRTKVFDCPWDDVRAIHIVHDVSRRPARLSLVVLPKNVANASVEIDLSTTSSVVRARTFFLKEVQKFFLSVRYSKREEITLETKKHIIF